MMMNEEEPIHLPGNSNLVSVIIVSYNTKLQLTHCLECLNESLHEVIVVDNHSTDGSPEMVLSKFPNVKLIQLNENQGFGRANNHGIELATNDLILFLNSDAYAKPGAIERLAVTMQNMNVVACGGKLLNPDGSLQESVTRGLSLWFVLLEQLLLEPVFRKIGLGYWITQQLQNKPESSVRQVMGACLMTRKSLGEQFDPRFFLYCEDTELCYRLISHGEIHYVPEAEFIHELGASSTNERWKSVIRYNKGKELYFRIHFGKITSALCWLINKVGALLRVLISLPLALLKTEHKAKLAIFWKVLWS